MEKKIRKMIVRLDVVEVDKLMACSKTKFPNNPNFDWSENRTYGKNVAIFILVPTDEEIEKILIRSSDRGYTR